jgi:hypothetical protein
VHVFERTPTGFRFVDVFCPEPAGRILEFIDAVATAA